MSLLSWLFGGSAPAALPAEEAGLAHPQTDLLAGLEPQQPWDGTVWANPNLPHDPFAGTVLGHSPGDPVGDPNVGNVWQDPADQGHPTHDPAFDDIGFYDF